MDHRALPPLVGRERHRTGRRREAAGLNTATREREPAPDGSPVEAYRRAVAARDVVSRLWPVAWGSFLGAALFLVARHAMPDDGLISLAYARNLAEHGEWALVTGVESHTATSALNIWLLAALVLLTGGHAFVACALLLMGCLAMTSVWLRRLGGDGRAGATAALLGPALLATSPVMTSSLGLETFLSVALLVGLVRYGVEGRLAASALLVAAAFLTRPDLVVAVVVVLVVLAAITPRGRRSAIALLAGGAIALPWYAWCWWHFGSAWPHTVAVKMAVGAWGGGTIADPTFFLPRWPVATAVTIVTGAAGAVAAVLATRRQDAATAALGLGGLAHFVVLAAASTPPSFYYLGPAVGGLGSALVLATVRTRLRWSLVPGAVVLLALALCVQHGTLWAEGYAPVRQNRATNAQYEAVARSLPVGQTVSGPVEIGALAFYCQDAGCRVLDTILADPVATDVFVEQWRSEHPWGEWNYARYRSPVAGPPPPWRLEMLPASAFRPGTSDHLVSRIPGGQETVRLLPTP